jgi:GxxExxY protein
MGVGVWRGNPCLNPDFEDIGEILRIMMRGEGVQSEDIGAITGAIIGAGMHVHSVLGSGFQEVVYQRALEIAFLKVGLSYTREKSMEIRYEGHKVGSRRVDFYVGEAVMVELKAVDKLEGIHLVQAKNYLEAYGEQHGLLLNFGGSSLEFKRLYGRRRKWVLSGSHNPEDSVRNPQNPGSDKGVRVALENVCMSSQKSQ